MKRREFVAGLGSGAAALGAAGCGKAEVACEGGATRTDSLNLKMVTTWPPNFPGLGTGANNAARFIEEASGGRIKIRVYAAGELVPAFEVFDAVSQGTADVGHGASYYWRNKFELSQLFTAVPFGLNAHEMNGWLYFGGGLEFWREAYEPFDLVPFPAGNTGVQLGGWFNKPIDSVKDLRGLKMRIPGLGGEVLKAVGGTPVTTPGGEIFTALQTGVIDATEWVGPYNDLAFGLHKAAKYYYYPGWQEPGPTLELIFNKKIWDGLADDLKAIVRISAQAANQEMMAEYNYRNVAALKQLSEDPDVEIRQFPQEVLDRLHEASDELLAKIADESDLARRTYESFTAFREDSRAYQAITEQAYLNTR